MGLGLGLPTDRHLVVNWIRRQRRKLAECMARVCWERLVGAGLQLGLPTPTSRRTSPTLRMNRGLHLCFNWSYCLAEAMEEEPLLGL